MGRRVTILVNQQLCQPANIASNQAYYNNLINTNRRLHSPATRSTSAWDAARGRRRTPGQLHLDAIRQVVGLKGGWGDVWTYDAYGSYGITDFNDREPTSSAPSRSTTH
jgi:hypothetical protein